jgi:hypothetical protein
MRTAALLAALIAMSASVVNAAAPAGGKSSTAEGLNPSSAGGGSSGGGSTTTAPNNDRAPGVGGGASKGPVDCVVSTWSEWSPCSLIKKQQHTRTIVKKAAKGGEACPALIETRACVAAKPASSTPAGSPVDCQVSDFGMWSICSNTSNGTQQRERTITRLPANGGKACPVLVVTQPCNTTH